jgi:hypothetical protein
LFITDNVRQAAAAAVADGTCSTDDLLDTVTKLRIEFEPLSLKN